MALYFILCALSIEHALRQHSATDLCLRPWQLLNDCKGFEPEPDSEGRTIKPPY